MKNKSGTGEPYEEFLVTVGYTINEGDGAHLGLRGRVDADMALPIPRPLITVAEMQHVAFAAKMAMYEVIVARKKAARKSKK